MGNQNTQATEELSEVDAWLFWNHTPRKWRSRGLKPRTYICPHCGSTFDRIWEWEDFAGLLSEEVRKQIAFACTTCRHRIVSEFKESEHKKRIQEILEKKEEMRGNLDKCRNKGVCGILKVHHEVLEEDPERLTSDFIIGLTCGRGRQKRYRKSRSNRGEK